MWLKIERIIKCEFGWIISLVSKRGEKSNVGGKSKFKGNSEVKYNRVDSFDWVIIIGKRVFRKKINERS